MTHCFSREHRQRLFFIIIIGAIVLRFVTFLLSTNYGADSISRSLISLMWSNDPFLIWHPNAETSVWLPLPFYINGVILMIWDDFSLVPRLASFILSMASLAVFYSLSRRLFSKEVSLAALACFAVYTMHIKHGNIASSESIFIFFILASIYFYERLLRQSRWFVVAALSVSLAGAAMTRFETWLLPPFMIVASILSSRNSEDPPRIATVRSMIIASVLPGLFILSWMYGSHREFGDASYSLHEASAEHAALATAFAESGSKLRVVIYNAAFWPGILLTGLSPLIFAAGIWGMIRGAIGKQGIAWVVFAALILAIYYYKSIVTGELAPLARYTILPGTIMCLFAGLGISDFAGRIRPARSTTIVFTILITGLVWAVLLSGRFIDSGDSRVRKLASVSPVTHYPGSLSPAIAWLGDNAGPTDKIIFSTQAYASNSIIMYSGLDPYRVVPVDEQDVGAMIEKIGEYRPTLLVLHRDSPLRYRSGIETFRDSLMIENVLWRRDTVAGEFGIYRSMFR